MNESKLVELKIKAENLIYSVKRQQEIENFACQQTINDVEELIEFVNHLLVKNEKNSDEDVYYYNEDDDFEVKL